jgi:tetratricopeptide (TPR) repeat protein
VAVVVGVALGSSVTGLGNGFAYDDVQAVQRNERLHSLADPARFLTDTYWPPGKFQGGSTLYRPLTSFAFALQWAAGDGRPFLFHLTNVLLYVAVAVVMFRLATILLPPLPAFLAAAFYAAHPVHVEAVGNVVGQGELWVNLFLLLAVGFFLRGRTAAGLSERNRLIICLCYALACLAKDNGLMLPGLLVAAELTVVQDPRPVLARLRDLVPFWAMLAATGVLYLVVRTTVTGTLAGDYPHILIGTATYGERLLTMLRVALEWPRLLLWPAHLQADYSPQDFQRATTFGLAQVLGLAMLLGTGWLAWWTRRRLAVVTFGILWLSVAIFPVSNLVLKAGIVLAERTLFLASAGAMLIVGAGIGALLSRRPACETSLLAAGVALVLLGTWRSATRQPVWRDTGTLFAQSVQDAPRNYRVHWTYALYLYENGYRESAFKELATAMELFPADPSLFADAGDLYRTDGQCDRSIVLYGRALALTPGLRFTRSRLASCYMRLGRFAEARHELLRLAAEGAPEYAELIPAVDSAAAASDSFR